jgi:hypothetical protein
MSVVTVHLQGLLGLPDPEDEETIILHNTGITRNTFHYDSWLSLNSLQGQTMEFWDTVHNYRYNFRVIWYSLLTVHKCLCFWTVSSWQPAAAECLGTFSRSSSPSLNVFKYFKEIKDTHIRYSFTSKNKFCVFL